MPSLADQAAFTIALSVLQVFSLHQCYQESASAPASELEVQLIVREAVNPSVLFISAC